MVNFGMATTGKPKRENSKVTGIFGSRRLKGTYNGIKKPTNNYKNRVGKCYDFGNTKSSRSSGIAS
jgi:hypothetical protein